MEQPELIVPDAAGWQAWLAGHADRPDGVWLVLAKKGVTEPTSLAYDQALDEALCHGWIDGQKRGRDERTHLQRFTPRRARSRWSARNVGLVERLVAEGRMRPAGQAEVDRAQADGRWAAAYAGSADAQVPADLAAALDADPAAREMFDRLNRTNRYAVIFRVEAVTGEAARARRVARFVDSLARGQTPHPQG